MFTSSQSRKDNDMSATLVGRVKYNRLMQGKYEKGKRQGQEWEFLSLEIVDTTTGFTWSCQLPSEAESYQEFPDDSLKNHKVLVKIGSQSAGPRTLPDGTQRMQIRSQLIALEDLGVPKDDE
jgi:hypothetical protein